MTQEEQEKDYKKFEKEWLTEHYEVKVEQILPKLRNILFIIISAILIAIMLLSCTTQKNIVQTSKEKKLSKVTVIMENDSKKDYFIEL